MRRAPRIDNVHAEIREGLKVLGCSIQDTASMGRSFADLVVGWRGATYLVECKTPRKLGGHGPKLTPGQEEARLLWRGGPWLVVTSLGDACQQMGMERELVQQLEVTPLAMGDPIPAGGCGCRDNGVPIMRANCRLHGDAP